MQKLVRSALPSSAMDPVAAAAAGAEIKQARTARGWSQAKLARATGLNPETVGRLERGEVGQSTKLPVLQSFLEVGPYALEGDPAEDLDMAALSNRQLFRLIHRAATEVEARFSGDDGAPRRRASTSRRPAASMRGPQLTAWATQSVPEVAWSDGANGKARA